MAPSGDEASAGSILRELIFNQYQAIVLGGTALASLVALNPLPLLLWFGSELVLLPMLDSGPLRRLAAKRRREIAKREAEATRAKIIGALSPANARRYAAMNELCRLIETNYQSLTGISQAYLAEQRTKLDMILNGCLHRMMALQRYERMPESRRPDDIQDEIDRLEQELAQGGLPERAEAALTKNLELKRRLLASYSEVGGTVKTLSTELDSMASLLEVLHQNSMSLRDPQAISEELDTIVRQSEESERAVREMESLLRSDIGSFSGDLAADVPETVPDVKAGHTGSSRRKVKER